MKAKEHKSELIEQLINETTPEEMERIDKEMSKQKTAVEWLKDELELFGDPQFCKIEWEQLDLLIEQAKEMERFRIENAYNDGAYDSKQNQYKGMHEYYKGNYGGVNEKDN